MIVIVVTIIVLMTIAAFFSAAETALTAASKPLMHICISDESCSSPTLNNRMQLRRLFGIGRLRQ